MFGYFRFQVEGIKSEKLSNVISELDSFRKMISGVNKINRYGFIDSAQDVQHHQAVRLKRGAGEQGFTLLLILSYFLFYSFEIHVIKNLEPAYRQAGTI